jgi:hypothetical protein
LRESAKDFAECASRFVDLFGIESARLPTAHQAVTGGYRRFDGVVDGCLQQQESRPWYCAADANASSYSVKMEDSEKGVKMRENMRRKVKGLHA